MTQTPTTRPRVLIVAGYFDWFSGYQETALASALSSLADVHVMASDRVSPAFSDAHLAKLGLSRRYPVARTRERGVTVTRFPSIELRSMVWSRCARRQISAERCDLIIQVMPGQLLSAAPTFTRNRARKVALYGDNRAMWSQLTLLQRLLKGAVFAASKGLLYTLVNLRADSIFGYTPNTQKRLQAFSAGHAIRLMPLCFTSTEFYFDGPSRMAVRKELGYAPDDIVIISAGKLHPQKRLEWLLGAFDQLSQIDPRVHLLIVGDDRSTYSEDLHREATSTSAAERVSMHPFAVTSDLNRLFNAADIGVWPRNPAITIQQAMGTGLLVVLPENDLVGHLIRPGSGRSYAAEPGNEVDQLLTALQIVMEREGFTAGMRRARAETNSWLSSDNAGDALLSFRSPSSSIVADPQTAVQ